MIINNERALAYVVNVDETKPLPGYDRVKYARTNGWWCIVGVDEVEVGDKAIYFEIDSLVPESDERFAFMEKRSYRVKTQKMCKVVSQGLMMPLAVFPELGDLDVGTDVTKKLNVKYYEPEDNARKRPSDPNAKYKSMGARHPKLAKKKWFRWLMKRNWGRKLLFVLFGRKRDNKKSWPSWVIKTDEERCQNQPWRFGNNSDQKWIVTEKIDGTSTTATYRKGRKYGFYICSRNVVFDKPNKKCFYETNVYTEMAEKYHFEDVLKDIVDKFGLEWATIQGETYGAGIQKRDYTMIYHDFAAFNLIFSDVGRVNSYKARDILKEYNIPWVPLICDDYVLPDTVEEMLEYAEGKSYIDGLPREGVVLRSQDGSDSFKAVSNSFLMKYHG